MLTHAVCALQASTSWQCTHEASGSQRVKLSPDEKLRFSQYMRAVNHASDVDVTPIDEKVSGSAQDRLRFTPAVPLQGWKSDSPAVTEATTTLERERHLYTCWCFVKLGFDESMEMFLFLFLQMELLIVRWWWVTTASSCLHRCLSEAPRQAVRLLMLPPSCVFL